MTVTFEKMDGYTLVSVEGRIDTNNYNQFEDRMMEAIGTETPKIILDCAELYYMSSSGLRVFILIQKKMTATNRLFTLCNLQEGIREIFEISGLTPIFDIRTDRASAIGS